VSAAVSFLASIILMLVATSWPSPSQAVQSLQEWHVVLEWEVGDQDGPLSFTQPSDLTVGPCGEIFVAQPAYREIWVIDREGAHIRTIGRGGEGPGEFRSPSLLFWRGDSLAVFDPRLDRISIFSRRGEFHRSAFAPPLSGRLGFLGHGRIVRVQALTSASFLPGRPRRLALELRRMGSPEVDTVAVLSVAHSRTELRGSGLTGFISQPFSDDPLWGIFPDESGLVVVYRSVDGVVRNGAFSVSVFDGAGALVASRSIPFQPVPLQEATVEALAQARSAAVRAGLVEQGATISPRDFTARAFRDAWYVPPVHPPVEDLALGRDGEIWIRREFSPSDGREHVDWWVLDREARPLARVSLPADLELVRPTGDGVVAVRKDEMDVYRLVRFELLHPGPELSSERGGHILAVHQSARPGSLTPAGGPVRRHTSRVISDSGGNPDSRSEKRATRSGR
jgi:hypothetical protein